MTKYKQRAVAILFVLGSILALISAWDDSEDWSEQTEVSGTAVQV
jgi:hypothetical protein